MQYKRSRRGSITDAKETLHKKQRSTAHKRSRYKRNERHLKDPLRNYKRLERHGERCKIALRKSLSVSKSTNPIRAETCEARS
jgi:hypothetical protein